MTEKKKKKKAKLEKENARIIDEFIFFFLLIPSYTDIRFRKLNTFWNVCKGPFSRNGRRVCQEAMRLADDCKKKKEGRR